eukprot:1160490-Pelagomonas_calceolata.AAC.9
MRCGSIRWSCRATPALVAYHEKMRSNATSCHTGDLDGRVAFQVLVKLLDVARLLHEASRDRHKLAALHNE